MSYRRNEEPPGMIEQRVWSIICSAFILIALLVIGFKSCSVDAASPSRLRELGLCYDRARWPEAQRIAKRGGAVVLNIDDGRGADKAETLAWDRFAGMLRSAGGITLGYVDYLDARGIRKGNGAILAEALAWIDAGHNGVWLDDARDTRLDADLIATLRSQRPKALVWANPGTRINGPLRASGALLCQSESNGSPDYTSAIVIAFATPSRVSRIITTATRSGVQWLAIEPLDTYHVKGVEYQRSNPLVP